MAEPMTVVDDQNRKDPGPAPNPEASESAVICNRRGLHARAAAKFAKLAAQFDCDIEVTRQDQTVSGQSIMGLMMLAAGPGSTVEISAYGLQAEEAVAALCSLVRRKFDED
jgi:phosphocarrier protein